MARDQAPREGEIALSCDMAAVRRGESGGVAEDGGAQRVVTEFSRVVVGDAVEGAGGHGVLNTLEGETAGEDGDASPVAQ